MRWLVGTRLLGQAPSASDDGIALQIEKVHGRVGDPGKITGSRVDLTLRDSAAGIFDGEGSSPSPTNPLPLLMQVSDDRRRVTVSAVQFMHPSSSFTDDRLTYVTVTATVSCDGQPPPPRD